MPQGSWKFDEDASFGAMIYQMIHTAREMGITLSDFLSLSEDERAMQMVFTQLKSKIEQVSAEEQRKKAKTK